MDIKYPKQDKVIRITNKKPNNNNQDVEMENQIKKIKYQIDELETNSSELWQSKSDTNEKITELTNTVSSHTTSISGLGNRLTMAEQSISANSSAITTANGNIAQNTSDISSLNQRLGNTVEALALQGTHINTAEGNILALQSGKQDKLTAGTGITIENNVISSTGGGSGGGSCNCAEDILDLQSAVASLQQQVLDLRTPLDPYYVGQSFSDYPAGTIVQTYDCYEKRIDFTTTGSYIAQKVYFCAEANSSATIKFKFTYKSVSQNSTNFLFTVYLNDSIVNQETIELSDYNIQKTHSITLYGQNLNGSANNNNTYFTIGLVSNTGKIQIDDMQIEIIAPNIDIVNKPKLINVESIDGTYYITDCSSGTARICEIANTDIVNANTLQYTDTQISAQNMIVAKNYISYNSAYVENDKNLIYHKNNKFYIYSQKNDVTEMVDQKVLNYDWSPSRNSSTAIPIIFDGLTYRTYTYFTSSRTFGIGTIPSAPANPVDIVSIKYNGDYKTYTGPTQIYGYVTQTGEIIICSSTSSSAKRINLGYGMNPKIYVTSYTSASKYTLDVYYRYYDRILKKTINFTSSGYTQVGDTQDIGIYENFFLGSNNDYFVIKNNVLEYHKFI